MYPFFTIPLLEFLTAIARLYSVPQLLGFALVLSIVLIVSARDSRAQRFFRRSFRTDVAHATWFPVYTILIGLPLSLRLAGIVTDHLPFLRVNLLSGLPTGLNIALWFTASDFTLYWLHRSMHRSRWLWTLHKVHHSQRELNPLTTWRVHWLEWLYFSLGPFMTGVVMGNIRTLPPLLIGSLAAVQFGLHSDLDWSYGPVGRLIVSPRFHARHHSLAPEDVNTNFGGVLVIWDYLFGTARNVAARAPAHGLAPADNDVPDSFFGQQTYPLSVLLRRSRRLNPPLATSVEINTEAQERI